MCNVLRKGYLETNHGLTHVLILPSFNTSILLPYSLVYLSNIIIIIVNVCIMYHISFIEHSRSIRNDEIRNFGRLLHST